MTTDRYRGDWQDGHVPRLATLQWAFIGLNGMGAARGKFGRVVELWKYNDDRQVLVEYESTTPDIIEFTRRVRPAYSLSIRNDGHIFLHDWKVRQMSVEELMLEHIPVGKSAPRYDHVGLVDDLRNNGLRWPIIVPEHGGHIIGSNRLRAAAKLGWETIPCYVVPLTVREMQGM